MTTRTCDLGYPLMTTVQTIEYLGRRFGAHVIANQPEVPYPGCHQDISLQHNRWFIDLCIACFQTKIIPPLIPPTCVKKKHYYAITLTTQVTNNIPRKGYYAYLASFNRIPEKVKSIIKMDGYFELTKIGALHMHIIVESNDYINPAKIKQANGNEFVKVDKMKTDKQRESTIKYITKDLNHEECLKVIHKECPNAISTTVTFPKPN